MLAAMETEEFKMHEQRLRPAKDIPHYVNDPWKNHVERHEKVNPLAKARLYATNEGR
jgi:hypothetical protein